MDEIKRGRAWRRAQSKRVQSKRLKWYLDSGFWKPEWVQKEWVGQLKKRHFGCGCPMCKPWKWGFEGDKPSIRRKLQEDE